MAKTLELAFLMQGALAPSFSNAMGQATAKLGVVEKKTKAISAAAQKRLDVKSIKELKKAAEDTGKSFGSLRSEITGSFLAIAAPAAAAGAAIYGVATTSANYADQAIKNAQSVGMSTAAFTEIAYAAKMAGVSQQDFVSGSAKLSKSVESALAGNKQMSESFARAGIGSKELAASLGQPEKLYAKLADTFASMPDGIEKTSLSMALFGKAGAKFIPLLNAGNDALNQMREDARRLGISLSETDAKNAEAFNDSFANIGEAMRGVSLTIGKVLWPHLTKGHEAVSQWISTNGEFLAQNLPRYIDEFAAELPALKQNLFAVGTGIKSGAIAVDGIVQSMGGWAPIIKAVVGGWMVYRGLRIGIALGQTAKSVYMFGQAFVTAAPAIWKGVVAAKAFGAALLLNPVGLVIAGISALIGTLYLLYTNWDSVTAFMQKTWDMLPGWIQAPLAKVGQLFNYFFGPQLDKVKVAFKEGFISGLIETIKQFNPLTIMYNALDGLVKFISGYDLATCGKALVHNLAGGMMSAWNAVKGKIATAVTDWIPGGSYLVDGASAAASGVSAAAGWVGGKLSTISPFANGGLVTAPQVGLVGEAGPEVIVPLNRPSRAGELMDSAARMLGWSGGGNAGRSFVFAPTVTVQGGDGSAAAAVRREMERLMRDFVDMVDRRIDQRDHARRRLAYR